MENRSKVTELQMRRIISRYQLGDLLGKGAYSEVFKAKHQDNGNLFAVKIINNKILADSQKVKECINNQLAIHQILQPCPHIVRFHQLLQTKNNCYFVYQYCGGGTLHDLLKKEGRLSEKKALSIFSELVSGLKVLRKNNIMHRDLKPENVLIKEGIFKLADFGFCKQLSVEMMTRTMLGSPLYMAPQILRGQAYSVNADIWSIGVILYEMLSGTCPYQSNSIASLISTIDEQPLHFDGHITAKLKKFISRCLQKQSKLRFSWEEFFEQTSHFGESNSNHLTLSNRSLTPLGRTSPRINGVSTNLALDETPKRILTPKKNLSEMKSKYELFKQNYHKQSPSDHSTFHAIENIPCKNERSKSATRQEPKEKGKDPKISLKQLIIQHQRCTRALKACLEIMETRDKKQIIQAGSVLKGVHKVLERIYSRINIEDIDMLPVLSMIKYEMIQVQKMQGQIQKGVGFLPQDPDNTTLPKTLAEPWALLSSY